MIVCLRARSVLLSLALRLLGCSGVLLLGALPSLSHAQITLDGSLGPRGALTGPHYTISDSMGQIRGPNLFHSFGQFNLSRGESATFTGPNTIAHILSRVTGGSPSTIDGTIRSQIPGAHLFLLNPSGVMFGPHASLDVKGALHVSTADYLRLADGARFSAHLSASSTLSVAPPVAFGFLGPMPAAITVEGSTLQVPEGATLSVVGGDIAITGQGALTAESSPTLGAPGGRITLASMASAGEVPVHLQEFTGEPVARLGHVALSQGALLDTSGDGGGLVRIRSGRLVVDGSGIFADNRGTADGTGRGVDLEITTEAALTNRGVITTDSLGTGRARELRVHAGTLSLTGGSQISSSTTGPGTAGVVEVQADQLMMQEGAFIGSSTSGLGAGGRVSVQASQALTLTGGARIASNTQGPGQGGTVRVTATDTLTLAGTSPDGRFPSAIVTSTLGTDAGAGAAGHLVIAAPRVTLANGAQINSNTLGPGPGGSVTVMASDTVMITGQSGLFSVTTGEGDAGQLTLRAPTVHLADGGIIGAPSFDRGRSGDIVLEVGTMTLTGGAQVTNTSLGSGSGGSVSLTATEALTITGHDQAGVPSGLSFDTFGVGDAAFISIVTRTLQMEGGAITVGTSSPGNAGSILIAVLERMTLTGGAQIVGSSRGSGQGGRVSLLAGEALTITGHDQAGVPSGLSFDTFGVGEAGAIDIATPTLQVDGGAITASTSGPGDAGIIDVHAVRMTLTGGAQIVGSSRGSGQGGRVSLRATEAITISGHDQAGVPSALSFDTFGAGGAGAIRIAAPTLQVDGGAITANTTGAGAGGTLTVEARTFTLTGGAQLSSSTAGEGRGGTLAVQGLEGVGSLADVVALAGQGSGLFTSAEGSGPGGNMTLQARTIELTQGARLAAASTGTGNAGGITLMVGDTLVLRGDSAVTTEASQATGGNIRVTASARVRLQDSQISATVSGGAGDGGNVTIDPEFILLQGSQITANAVAGNGGRITLIATKALLADPSSAVTASSTLGINGQVNIQAPVTSISGAVAPLPQSFARAAELLRDRCGERLRGGTVSRFVLGGRDGVPREPGALLLSPLVQGEQPGPAPLVETGEEPHEASYGHMGGREMPNTGDVYLRGTQAHTRWPGALDVECAQWKGK